MTDVPQGDRVRHAALELLGSGAPDEARDVLERADIVVEPDVHQWEDSDGSHAAHRVVLGVSAHDLGAIQGRPHVRDALSSALANALVALRAGTLADLATRWLPTAPQTSAYRGTTHATAAAVDRDDPDVLRAAIAEYLRAEGHNACAERVEHASLVVTAHASRADVTVELAANVDRTTRAADAEHIRDAARALLAPRRVHVKAR